MRVLEVGDGQHLTTGFAHVIRRVTDAFLARGWDVGQLTCLERDANPWYERNGIAQFVPDKDAMGYTRLADAVKEFRPDALFLGCDPGSGGNWIAIMADAGVELPVVGYFPVEGGPVHPVAG